MDLDLGAHDGGQHRRHEPGTEGIVLSKFKHPTWKPRARHDLRRRLEDPKRRDTVQHISANATTGFYAHIRCEMSLSDLGLVLCWHFYFNDSVSPVVGGDDLRTGKHLFLEPARINLDPPCSRFRDPTVEGELSWGWPSFATRLTQGYQVRLQELRNSRYSISTAATDISSFKHSSRQPQAYRHGA